MRRVVLQQLFNGPVFHSQCLDRRQPQTLPIRDPSPGGPCVELQNSGRVHGGALAFFLDAVGSRDSYFRANRDAVSWNGEIFKEAPGDYKCSLYPLRTKRMGPATPKAITPQTSVMVPPMWAFDHFRRKAFDPRGGR